MPLHTVQCYPMLLNAIVWESLHKGYTKVFFPPFFIYQVYVLCCKKKALTLTKVNTPLYLPPNSSLMPIILPLPPLNR